MHLRAETVHPGPPSFSDSESPGFRTKEPISSSHTITKRLKTRFCQGLWKLGAGCKERALFPPLIQHAGVCYPPDNVRDSLQEETVRSLTVLVRCWGHRRLPLVLSSIDNL